MTKKAEGTAQTHATEVRQYLQQYLPDLQGGPTPGVPTEHPESGSIPTNRAEWLKFMHPGERRWRYKRIAGLLGFEFEWPVLWDEARSAFREYGSSVQENIPGTQAIVGRCAVLTRTSKMGCYSWNMPAGPMSRGGTCPGSTMGYRLWEEKPGKDSAGKVLAQASMAQVKKAIEAAKKRNEDLRSAVPGTVEQARMRFICNGCYALKGAYGNPSIILVMEWRKRWRDWALEQGEFVDVMVEAIRMAREKSKKFKPETPEELAVRTHPNFFRIHDSGDFDSEPYLEAWLEICRKLPYVHFWAPTRVWADAGEPGRKAMSAVLEKHAKHIPSNLAIRPSGLFFDGPYPEFKTLAGGATSTEVLVKTERAGLRVSIPAVADDAWGCPAYLPSAIGGGALPKRPGKKGDDDEVARLANPVVQRLGMFPQLDEASGLPPDAVFYDALVDKQGRFIIDPHTGQPVTATKDHMEEYSTTRTAKSQAFQTSGACSLARDHHGAAECRVCWGVSEDRPDAKAKRLPIVYGKH